MGHCKLSRAGRSGKHLCAWVLWLLLVHGAVWRASSATQCSGSCSADVKAVCGKDGKSYINSCVASCAGVEVLHSGYCRGEKIKFVQPNMNSGIRTARQGGPNWRLARESAAVITHDVLTRFQPDGYIYRGRVALSTLPMYVKESTAAVQVASDVDSADGIDGADTADTVSTLSSTESVSNADTISSTAATEQAEKASSSLLEVAVIRVDNEGNLYHKTFKYDPRRFTQTAYRPFDPAVLGSAPAQQAATTPAAATSAPTPAAGAPAPSSPAPGFPAPARTSGSAPAPVTSPPAKAPSSPAPAPTSPAQAPAKPPPGSPVPTAPAVPAKAPAAAPPASLPPGSKAAVASPAPKPAPPAKTPPASPAAKASAGPPASPVQKGAQFAEWGPDATGAQDGGISGGGSSSGSSSGSGGASVGDSIDYFSMVERPPAGPPSGPVYLPPNPSAANPPAAHGDASDFFSMVDWHGGSELESGELLQPEMGSYANANISSSNVNSVSSIVKDNAGGSSEVAGSNSSSMQAGVLSNATGNMLAPASSATGMPALAPSGNANYTQEQPPEVAPESVVVAEPSVMHAGAPELPGGGVTTAIFPTETETYMQQEDYTELGPQDEKEEQQLQQQVQELLKKQQWQQQQQQQAEQQAAQTRPALVQQQQPEQNLTVATPQTVAASTQQNMTAPVAPVIAADVATVQPSTTGCNFTNMTCTDRVAGMSKYFGVKPSGAKYMDQVPMVGKGRVKAITMYYNKTSGCLRGMQLTYNHVSHPASFFTSVLLGSAVTPNSNIVVKTLKLGQQEVINKAEVYAPKCVQYVKLFTSKNNSVLVGKADPAGLQYTPAVQRPGNMLVAVRGFQDKAVYKAAAKDQPPGVFPGVLKQLQFVWGETVCNCSEAATAAAATAVTTEAASTHSNRSSSSSSSNGNSSSSSGGSKPGRRLAEVTSSSTESQRLQELRRRRLQQIRLKKQISMYDAEEGDPESSSAGSSSSFGSDIETGSDGDGSLDIGTGHMKQRHSAMTRYASVIGLGMDGNMPVDDGPGIHRMLSVIYPDSRQPCPLLTYPYKTMGQINAKAVDGGFVCSGGLIGEDRVLTAGHCVWDDRDTQGPFKDLSFSPAQWKKDGKTTAPLGQVDWDYVTLFEAYINDPDGEGLAYDVSVITLKRAVGKTLGYLGIKADVAPCKSTAMSLTLAGYPGDDPEYPIPGGWQGGCFYDTCTVNFSCSVSITNHTCDSYVGQSGAPMYDKEYYVRAVHTLGVLPGFSTQNGAITIQKFILDNVMGYWKETDGFSLLQPNSLEMGGFY